MYVLYASALSHYSIHVCMIGRAYYPHHLTNSAYYTRDAYHKNPPITITVPLFQP